MATESRRLSVSLSLHALASLEEIWDWNAKTYGADHADRYIEFLRAQTQNLATTYALGRPVPTRATIVTSTFAVGAERDMGMSRYMRLWVIRYVFSTTSTPRRTGRTP